MLIVDNTSVCICGFPLDYFPSAQTPDGITGDRINRAYVLQRWVQACGGRGNYPIKFNGTIFTVDSRYTDSEVDFNPDYRRWGGDFCM